MIGFIIFVMGFLAGVLFATVALGIAAMMDYVSGRKDCGDDQTKM